MLTWFWYSPPRWIGGSFDFDNWVLPQYPLLNFRSSLLLVTTKVWLSMNHLPLRTKQLNRNAVKHRKMIVKEISRTIRAAQITARMWYDMWLGQKSYLWAKTLSPQYMHGCPKIVVQCTHERLLILALIPVENSSGGLGVGGRILGTLMETGQEPRSCWKLKIHYSKCTRSDLEHYAMRLLAANVQNASDGTMIKGLFAVGDSPAANKLYHNYLQLLLSHDVLLGVRLLNLEWNLGAIF